jgi:DinB superfamily
MCRLLTAVSVKRESELIYGDWTVREMLVHIAAWDHELVRGLDELLRGRRPSFADYDAAVFNAHALVEAGVKTLEDVIEDAKVAHSALVDSIATLSDEDWERTSRFRWSTGNPMSVASLFQYTYKGQTHYAGHTDEIEHSSSRESDTAR